MTFIPSFHDPAIIGYTFKKSNVHIHCSFNRFMTEEKNLSALERLLMGLDPLPETTGPPLRKGAVCPICGEGELDYNGLLQLECPSCGYVNGEGGGCT